MLFNSPIFLFIFLPALLAIYCLAPNNIRLKNNILLVASLLFYAWGEPFFVFILILSIIFNWFMAIKIEKAKPDSLHKKSILFAAIIPNILLIFIFKYLNFTLSSINDIFSSGFRIYDIALPIGISFFTFQSLSYIIDVYRMKSKAKSNLLDVGLYISIFPQLIAGPIVRYETISKEIDKRKVSGKSFAKGIERFVIGLAKKVLIANNVAIVADSIFNYETCNLSLPTAWLGAIAYTLQIYFDFSGYSDMAIGLGKMFGFNFPENFKHPYVSLSISEFWRRWHITLGTWFRDYVYIPLGGNRHGIYRTVINLFAVWFLTGLWHGANYTFIVWGLYFFVLITFEKIVKYENINAKPIRFIITILLIIIGWVIFRSPNIESAIHYVRTMFSGNIIMDSTFTSLLNEHYISIITASIISYPILSNKNTYKFIARHNFLKLAFLIVLFAISICYITKGAYSPFIYFNF